MQFTVKGNRIESNLSYNPQLFSHYNTLMPIVWSIKESENI